MVKHVKHTGDRTPRGEPPTQRATRASCNTRRAIHGRVDASGSEHNPAVSRFTLVRSTRSISQTARTCVLDRQPRQTLARGHDGQAYEDDAGVRVCGDVGGACGGRLLLPVHAWRNVMHRRRRGHNQRAGQQVLDDDTQQHGQVRDHDNRRDGRRCRHVQVTDHERLRDHRAAIPPKLRWRCLRE